jgi:biopolymer transport protein ExbB
MLQEKFMSFALLGAEWVMWLLVVLSIACLAVAAERVMYRLSNRSPSARLQGALKPFFEQGDTVALEAKLAEIGGLESRVLQSGLRAAAEGGAGAADEAMAGTLLFERLKLERGLIVLGTVGSNAPFLGLFGTVLGIIKAFNDLSIESAEASAAVMAGISEALVATAIGLMVAIPAVVLYNWFQRANKDQLGRVESLAHLVLSRLRHEAPQGA